jgi:hypothetical protein
MPRPAVSKDASVGAVSKTQTRVRVTVDVLLREGTAATPAVTFAARIAQRAGDFSRVHRV